MLLTQHFIVLLFVRPSSSLSLFHSLAIDRTTMSASPTQQPSSDDRQNKTLASAGGQKTLDESSPIDPREDLKTDADAGTCFAGTIAGNFDAALR